MQIRENILNKTSIKEYNGFSFEELSNISKINLRGNYSDKDFISNTEIVLGALIPFEPNTFNSNNKLKIIWLSPNEWLIEIYKISDFNQILLDLKKSLNTQNTAVTDITENRTILELKGVNLYKLLSKFMVIDLDSVLNKKFSTAQTILTKLPVLIIRNYKDNEDKNVHLYVNRSHAQFIINLLIDGSKNINF